MSCTIDDPSEGLETGSCYASRAEASGEQCRQGNVSHILLDNGLTWTGLVRCCASRKTIDDIPDDVLLDIFGFYGISPMYPETVYSVWEWHVLAHVCRKWRDVVFASADRLGLRLHCTPITPARKTLDIWPPLPIVVDNPPYLHSHPEADDDNLIAALEQRDRVCMITMPRLTHCQLDRFDAVMQEPFPALTRLYLGSNDEVAPVLPVTFMGGSAPCLQCLEVTNISFPTLPNLVLSPNDLTSIELCDIPSTSYISPDAMVAFLSPLTRLRHLIIECKSPSPSDPTSRRVTLPTRALLPALVYFRFKGTSEYLEDMVVQIDTPLLSILDVVLFNQLTFSIPRLSRFIHRAETLKSLSQVELSFSTHHVLIKLSLHVALSVSLCVPCTPSDWQLSSIRQLCGQILPLPFNVERLEIYDDTIDTPKWQDNIDHAQWLEVLQPFTSVRELHVSETMWPLLAPILKEHTGERTMDVLPMLCDLFLGGTRPSESLPEAVEPFVSARKLAGHPIVVHH